VQHSARQVLWLHAARDGAHQPFAAEVSQLMATLGNARRLVCYSQPRAQDVIGRDFDANGHLSRAMLESLGLPPEAESYLCGPPRFMSEMKDTLAALGIAPGQIHVEVFAGGQSLRPGVVETDRRPPHPPPGDRNSGPLISFARSSITAHWKPGAYKSLLEFAEMCDVPVRWSCRSGVCHNCESGLVSGDVVYSPDPLEPAAAGNVLLCCAQPTRDLVLDL
jgi:ferredoxin-NADP reductase